MPSLIITHVLSPWAGSHLLDVNGSCGKASTHFSPFLKLKGRMYEAEEKKRLYEMLLQLPEFLLALRIISKPISSKRWTITAITAASLKGGGEDISGLGTRALPLQHDWNWTSVKEIRIPCSTGRSVWGKWRIGSLGRTNCQGNSLLYTFTAMTGDLRDTLRDPQWAVAWASISDVWMWVGVLPIITRRKRTEATPALAYNMVLMWWASSFMSSMLGTSMGGTRNPRAIPSCRLETHN